MAPSEKDTNKKEIKEEEQDLVLMYPGQLNITIKEDQNHEFTDQDQYRHEVKEETLDPDFVDLQNWSSGVKQENQDSGAINYEHHFVKQDHIKSEIKEETQDLDISDRNHTKSEVEEENQKPNISDQNHHGGGIDEQDRNQDHRSSDPTERTDQQTNDPTDTNAWKKTSSHHLLAWKKSSSCDDRFTFLKICTDLYSETPVEIQKIPSSTHPDRESSWKGVWWWMNWPICLCLWTD
ncbi:uncharacterized protein LOC114861307 isoform X2 [Betta splendens]|uniref:Uncharacterized protein LOC114861307 isoform X2 n=1 Tax=Betta splendens TaxID=158456 RepID=A0A6P7NDJ6_BETSP|nr:uncharacterized protein LOC114861307 isoform X2 [Betta splendens]